MLDETGTAPLSGEIDAWWPANLKLQKVSEGFKYHGEAV